MRAKRIHHYFGIDHDLIWDVVENHIPKLKETINMILNKM